MVAFTRHKEDTLVDIPVWMGTESAKPTPGQMLLERQTFSVRVML